MRQGSGISAGLLVIVAFVIFGIVLWQNNHAAPASRPIVPTEAIPTAGADSSWQAILEAGFGSDSTPLPTIAIPTAPFVPPTLSVQGASTAVAASSIGLGDAALVTPFLASTPTLPPPTAAVAQTEIPITQIAVTQVAREWKPPPLIPPISRDPQGRDHYWFIRPVDSNANNRGLFYYPYGSDGPNDEWRVHAGLDMPNPIGETVRAAGDGTVVWAADGLRTQGGSFQDTYSYGNVVVIQHDFGYRGRPVFTLYAHLALTNVEAGQRVQAGDVIGLVGNTGRVTGPHVHFEVRLGEAGSSDVPTYANTYNPALWMAPYVGTGVIAGRVTDSFGNDIIDADITIRSRATGQVVNTTTTYTFLGTGVDVNEDPEWRENFVAGDVPAGRHEVVADIGGLRVSAIVNVVEGTTTFVELSTAPHTPTPAL